VGYAVLPLFDSQGNYVFFRTESVNLRIFSKLENRYFQAIMNDTSGTGFKSTLLEKKRVFLFIIFAL
jgi:hypothetical protein